MVNAGDIDASFGDAFLDGYSVRRDIKAVQQRLGYCPQFDATIEEMTGRETLCMFANLRGVPEHAIAAVVEDLTEKLLLRDHIDKQVRVSFRFHNQNGFRLAGTHLPDLIDWVHSLVSLDESFSSEWFL